MFRNYFKIAIRNLLKNQGFSFINLFGLTIGLACCLLIGLYIWNELSFDRYHSNADRIYRVSRQFFNSDGSEQLHLGHVAPPYGPLLENDFPDIEAMVRMLQNTVTFKKDDLLYAEDQTFLAGPSLFKIFDVPLLRGNPETALQDPFSIMLSESAAEKYFKGQDPINQTLQGMGQFEFRVTGVYQDFPYNSHMHPDLIASFATLRDSMIYGEEGLRTNWGNNSFSTYLLLPKGYPAKNLEAQFPAFLDKHMAGYYSMGKASERTQLHLMLMTNIHLHSHLDSEIEENGDMSRVYVFAIIALLVLIIACINYMNLSTARSANRAREIGIRKVVGARRQEIIMQFLSEAIILSVVATLLAAMLAQVALPFVNDMLGQELQVSQELLWVIPVATLGIAIVTGLLAGAYPAIFLSGMKPLSILKGGGGEGKSSGAALRKTLVVGQFAISMALIVATVVVYNQLSYMQNKDLGLNKDQVLALNFYNPLAPRYESFKNEILANPSFKGITRSSRLPAGRLLDSYGSADIQFDADTLEKTSVDLKSLTIDHHFVPTFELEMAAGRNYRNDQGNDRTASFIINEAAVRKIGLPSSEEAIGRRINYGGRDAHIVGILKDFNFESLHQEVKPMILFIPRDSSNYNYLSVKVSGDNLPASIAHLKSTWQKFMPQFPFDYRFLDEDFGALYSAEQRQGRVFIGFAMLAILVACLGLFGLTAFVAQQRVKEIGIRKVLGATTSGIVGLLSKDFMKLVLIAMVLASPIAWYIMNSWLENFAYRINIEWWVFIVAGILAAGIAFFTVSFQSIKAAVANPVDSLRSE